MGAKKQFSRAIAIAQAKLVGGERAPVTKKEATGVSTEAREQFAGDLNNANAAWSWPTGFVHATLIDALELRVFWASKSAQAPSSTSITSATVNFLVQREMFDAFGYRREADASLQV